MAKEDVLKGFLLGAATVVLIPVLRNALGERGESLGRAVTRAAGAFGEKARELAEEVVEIADDTFAELQSVTAQEATESSPQADMRETSSASSESKTA